MTGIIELDYQIALDESETKTTYVPNSTLVESWLSAALQPDKNSPELQLSVRVVDKEEITQLNEKYRKINKATNVLSFPFEAPEGVDVPLLGDIVICASVVENEAVEQQKAPEQHWAHMLIHGLLHLQGYDHQNPESAEQMESLEIKIMNKLGFPNPYGEDNSP